jgi:hypothetical protein
MMPSTISITPTESSSERPTRGGMTHPSSTMPAPTTMMVSVCPTPQSAPITAAVVALR